MHPAIPYLTFPGTCAAAMTFYADVFGADITVMTTLADAPLETPPEAADLVFNAELRVGDFVLKASDNPDFTDGAPSISLFITFDDSTRRAEVFSVLAESGEVLFELDGPFGMLRDRFGVQWMLTLAN